MRQQKIIRNNLFLIITYIYWMQTVIQVTRNVECNLNCTTPSDWHHAADAAHVANNQFSYQEGARRIQKKNKKKSSTKAIAKMSFSSYNLMWHWNTKTHIKGGDERDGCSSCDNDDEKDEVERRKGRNQTKPNQIWFIANSEKMFSQVHTS